MQNKLICHGHDSDLKGIWVLDYRLGPNHWTRSHGLITIMYNNNASYKYFIAKKKILSQKKVQSKVINLLYSVY